MGIKLCWLLNSHRQVVDCDWATMNVHDEHFHPLIQRYHEVTMVLADRGFRCVEGVLENCKLCQKGTWNECICVETARSLVTVALAPTFRLAWLRLHPDADPFQISIAAFSL